MSDNLLCKNLSLSIWLDQSPDFDTIKVRLVDKIQLKKVEKVVEITVDPSKMTSYHIQEAIVIAMRRLVSEAIKEGLISMPHGKSQISATVTRPGVKNITLSIPPDG